MLFGWGMLVGAIFLFFVPRDATGRLQYTYAQVFRWPLAAGSGLTRVARITAQEQRTIDPKDHEKLLQAYYQLRNNFANLQAQHLETNQRIELLTKLRAKPGLERMQPIPAKIITLGKDELTIDQGQASGVAVGQCVLSLTDSRLDDQCVIGVVAGVYASGARVKLITHPKCTIPVSIGTLNVHKIVMEGRGDGTARIPLLTYSDHEVKVGDVIYAEGKPGFLGVPMIAAEITQCGQDRHEPLMWDITVRPVCDCADLSDVVVMKPASVP
jgi:cell shape-determining protein MreC